VSTDTKKPDSDKPDPVKAKKKEPGKAGQGKQKWQGGASRVGAIPAQYKVHSTIVEMTLRIGHSKLASLVRKQWEGIHHAIHYLTDFSRRSVRGKVVTAANRGITEYMSEKVKEAQHMLDTASELAHSNGIRLGSAGATQELVVMVATDTERDVMDLIKLLDDYVIVMDSLWIGRLIDTKKRDDAHDEVCKIVTTLHRLLMKMREKMVDFRHKKLSSRLSRDEESYARDLETLVFDVTGINIRSKREAEEEAALVAKQAARAPKTPTPNKKPATEVVPDDTPEPAEELSAAVAVA